MGGALTIRPATTADHDAIARICLLTGDGGADATGVFGDDQAVADVYASPYLHGPSCFALVWDEGEGAVGYVVGTDDTRAFQDWFVKEWWPSRPPREPRTQGDRWLLPAALDPDRMLIDAVAQYPAHLHIDLLPAAQGRGAGRALIDAAVAGMRARGVPGVHLAASKANAGAQAFYPRVGFAPVAADHDSVVFARSCM
ncbi:GNAT family N-acetyltransferase [Demequina sp. SO4-18]|uniref:GNAT family N-acetyltransferase n=1 Tax=Demequina sp. SO4-18 TaxID=3401026 RepID=UPI003B5A2CA1